MNSISHLLYILLINRFISVLSASPLIMCVVILSEHYILFLVTLPFNVLFIMISMINIIFFVLSITYLVCLSIYNMTLVFVPLSLPILFHSIQWRKRVWLLVT